MKTGFTGTFVISWSQTEVDGLDARGPEALEVGAAWSWSGEAVRIDGPNDVLRLDRADGEAEIRRRAARKVRRLIGLAVGDRRECEPEEIDEPLMDAGFVVTNGAESFSVTAIEVGPGQPPLLMFVDEMPPRNTDLWIVHAAMGRFARPKDRAGMGVICFTPGTRIATTEGPTDVESLRQGDHVLTRDNGPQEIEWIGTRRMTGARFHVAPDLRPIRIGAGALGIERPDQELLVSPGHRMLVRGAAARALFNETEVLVAARDLVNGTTITVDSALREVTYVHLMLPSHQIIWANGVETESFHPASADLGLMDEVDRIRLFAHRPEIEVDPYCYGAYARRNLTTPESAILRHQAA